MSQTTLGTLNYGKCLLNCALEISSGLSSSPELDLVDLSESPCVTTSIRLLGQTGIDCHCFQMLHLITAKKIDFDCRNGAWSRAIERLHPSIWRDMGGSVIGAGTEQICESHEIMTDGIDANQVAAAREGGLHALHGILGQIQTGEANLEPNRNISLAFNFIKGWCDDDH